MIACVSGLLGHQAIVIDDVAVIRTLTDKAKTIATVVVRESRRCVLSLVEFPPGLDFFLELGFATPALSEPRRARFSLSAKLEAKFLVKIGGLRLCLVIR